MKRFKNFGKNNINIMVSILKFKSNLKKLKSLNEFQNFKNHKVFMKFELFELIFEFKILYKRFGNVKFNLNKFKRVFVKNKILFRDCNYNYQIDELNEKVFLEILKDILFEFKKSLNLENEFNNFKIRYIYFDLQSCFKNLQILNLELDLKLRDLYFKEIFEFYKNIEKLIKLNISKSRVKSLIKNKKIIFISSFFLLFFFFKFNFLFEEQNDLDEIKKIIKPKSVVEKVEKINKDSNNLNSDLKYWSYYIKKNINLKIDKNMIQLKWKLKFPKNMQFTFHVYDLDLKHLKSYVLKSENKICELVFDRSKGLGKIILVYGSWDENIGFDQIEFFSNDKKMMRFKDMRVDEIIDKSKNFDSKKSKAKVKESVDYFINNFDSFKVEDKIKVIEYLNDYIESISAQKFENNFEEYVRICNTISQNLTPEQIGIEFIEYFEKIDSKREYEEFAWRLPFIYMDFFYFKLNNLKIFNNDNQLYCNDLDLVISICKRLGRISERHSKRFDIN